MDSDLDELARLIQLEYGIEVQRVSAIDDGLEAAKAVVEDGDARYFVKVHPPGNAPWVEFSSWLTSELARRGCGWVMAPIPTRRRTLTATHHGAIVEVRRYVDAAAIQSPAAPLQLEQFGAVIADLHVVGAFAGDRVLSDDEGALVPRLEVVIERAAAVPAGDPRSAASRLIVANRASLRQRAALVDLRRQDVEAVRPRWTATHGDATASNFLGDRAGRVYLIDWAGACTAPAERDVLHYLSPDAAGFVTGYRRRHPDAVFDLAVFEYYLSRWQIDGVIEFGGRLCSTDRPAGDFRLMTAIQLFAPDRSAQIDRALAIADERLCR